MSKIRVLVNGARGRMGREVVRTVLAEDDLELAGETDLGDDLAATIRESKAQVVVDFTVPGSAVANARTILESGSRPVIGTTGFRSSDVEDLSRRARDLGSGGLIAPNFAIGAVLLMKFAAQAVRWFPDAEVLELHHENKVDAPSGTALKTVEMMRQALDAAGPDAPASASPPADSKEAVPGCRGGRYLGFPIHSLRLPGHVAHQAVIFGAPGQVLTLRHDAPDRRSFMPGVLLAIRKAPRLERLHYGLETILELE